MARKKIENTDKPDDECELKIVAELKKLSPKKGDILVLNINTDDLDVLYSNDILESVDRLSDTLEEFAGTKIPILVFGDELDLSILSTEEIDALIEHLQDLKADANSDEDEEELETLTEIFN